MAEVVITSFLEKQINKQFRSNSVKIFELLFSLEENPKKGKIVGQVGGVLIKELKYEKYRFYFITEGYKLKILSVDELKNLVIKFVRMSDKKSQQKVIDEIKVILRKLGDEGF